MQMLGVGDLDAHLGGAGRGIELVQDERDLAFEGATRIGAERNFDREADADEADVLLRHVGHDPDVAEIGDAKQLVARL